jgi:serine/threonine-protein kinase
LTAVPEAAVREQLERMLASKTFAGSQRSSVLLRFVVEETLQGRAAYLKEYALGAEALGRGADFDPRADPIARVEASRLRSRLDLYYAAEGARDAVAITLPKGGYAPVFAERTVAADSAPNPSMQGDSRSPRNRPALWFVLGAAVAATVVAAAAWRRTAEPPALEPLVQVDIDLGGAGVLGSEVGNDLALSPDGETLVFVALLPDGSTRLYARRLAELAAVELPGTIGARGPFFSPDGRSVGFWAQGSLKKTLVAGGSPVAVVTASDLQGASWGENDEIIATLDSTGRLFRVPADGGEPVPVFEPAPGTNARWPQHLPGGAILFTQARGSTASGVHVVRLGDGASRELLPNGTYGRYVPSGHLLYVDRGTLLAASFDVATLTLSGTPTRVLDGVVTSPSFGFAQLAVANDGTLVYQRTRGSGLTRMMWLDGSTAPPVPAVAEPGRYLWPRVAPDGRRVAVALLEDSDYDIWTYDLAAGTRSRITSAEGNQGAAVWTPDGRFLVYQSSTEGGIVAVRTDAVDAGELLLGGDDPRVPWSFTADGSRLAFHQLSATSGFDLWSAPLTSSAGGLQAGEPTRFYGTNVYETYPTFSPDGRWIAYGSNSSGIWEVYVRAFPDDGREVRVSTHGGRIPAWTRAGTELLYETNDHQLMVASYAVANGRFVPSPPRSWSPVVLADTGVLANFDLAPDGRVLALLPTGDEAEPAHDHATLVLNLFDELERIHPRPGDRRRETPSASTR